MEKVLPGEAFWSPMEDARVRRPSVQDAVPEAIKQPKSKGKVSSRISLRKFGSKGAFYGKQISNHSLPTRPYPHRPRLF
eukprot:1160501-Pelagomonas_calceolata.AAC.9